ncbi:hypothetical protein D0C37_02945 [Streptomyces koyangensis]|uniref:Type II toxin-antitoxin system RelE/ParE family toxin n=1 Tax=Streptomyces koyangensis TaxID=188770 RepID=A0A385D6Q5_9ACTN|nr:hypothetical protein D0C37_02945 [Streptomyces koyangensis]PKR44307.1 hypothetical protein CWE27_15830 [Streptomyces sp. EAG2]
MQFTEQVVRFRDYIPPADRRKFHRLVDRIAADPEPADSFLAYTDDAATRQISEDRLMIHYVVTRFFVVVIEADIYDASRGFNEV